MSRQFTRWKVRLTDRWRAVYIERCKYGSEGSAPKTYRRNAARRWALTLLKILISVVVGALLLAGLYMLFKDTLLPTLTQRIIDLFDFQG